ncbi:MAG: hypothetical protein N3I86_00895 [Verrucomicrobiae bacterium]|nr:hypothetical protein [Verrucomicrobiae bacterium]MDW8309501.1 hypothetical protein [Verrucomicrobiales bacterium]
MNTCLSFNDILEINQPPIREMARIANQLTDSESAAACETFGRQVRLVEGIVVQTYGLAAALARKADNLNEVAEVWRKMSAFCQSALEVLAGLREKFPRCGTAELYDLVLDYKLAADQRYRGVQEEIACQTLEIPKGLFPERM